MGFFSWVLFGLIAGWVARLLMPGPDRWGCLGTILLGVLGSVVGGFIGTRLGWGSVEAFDVRSLGIAIVGGLVVLFFVRLFKGRS
ncbi:MAG: GlsB/YeaQ/YmgE family stress response membrane protein [Planctomycetaceae bacterium]|nr:GlsB/YeaQ/YmgE family stress response membrane protein [Planctomycetaceae bacterium]